jgi:hypothetical protein
MCTVFSLQVICNITCNVHPIGAAAAEGCSNPKYSRNARPSGSVPSATASIFFRCLLLSTCLSAPGFPILRLPRNFPPQKPQVFHPLMMHSSSANSVPLFCSTWSAASRSRSSSSHAPLWPGAGMLMCQGGSKPSPAGLRSRRWLPSCKKAPSNERCTADFCLLLCGPSARCSSEPPAGRTRWLRDVPPPANVFAAGSLGEVVELRFRERLGAIPPSRNSFGGQNQGNCSSRYT